ncbi:unnamed protein product [Rotaria sp. Silwood1]|nr:unnamed protein product [Rotaria sp. Silwood1]
MFITADEKKDHEIDRINLKRKWQRTLANIIYFAAENIDQLKALMPQIYTIAHKHRALTVQPEHYSIVGKYILQAISEFLDDKVTSDILDAWSAAYTVIANIFIDTEKKLYDGKTYCVGDTILASLPAGAFAVVHDAKHHLCIVGGIGITVLSAMIEGLYKQE